VSSFPEQSSIPGSSDSRGIGDVRGIGDIPGLGAIPGAGDIPRTAGSPDRLRPAVDVDEASRQLELAAHDIAVASSCIGLGDLDEAHTNVITARAAADAAEAILRVALASGLGSPF
jgi:hypothetical protein